LGVGCIRLIIRTGVRFLSSQPSGFNLLPFGAQGLLNAVCNGARFILVILDNSITAMTGCNLPGIGGDADGHPEGPLPRSARQGMRSPVSQDRQSLRHQGMIREVRKAYRYTKEPDGGMAVLIARYPCITHQKEQLKVTPSSGHPPRAASREDLPR